MCSYPCTRAKSFGYINVGLYINVKLCMTEFDLGRTTCVLVIIVRLEEKYKKYKKYTKWEMYEFQKYALAFISADEEGLTAKKKQMHYNSFTELLYDCAILQHFRTLQNYFSLFFVASFSLGRKIWWSWTLRSPKTSPKLCWYVAFQMVWFSPEGCV